MTIHQLTLESQARYLIEDRIRPVQRALPGAIRRRHRRARRQRE